MMPPPASRYALMPTNRARSSLASTCASVTKRWMVARWRLNSASSLQTFSCRPWSSLTVKVISWSSVISPAR
jgi:hypothetical protein